MAKIQLMILFEKPLIQKNKTQKKQINLKQTSIPEVFLEQKTFQRNFLVLKLAT